MLSVICLNLDKSKILSSGNGLILFFCKELTLSRTFQEILDSSKLKEFAADNSKFDENGKKFSKWVENTLIKGEIAHYEQFLHFPQCFLKICTAIT